MLTHGQQAVGWTAASAAAWGASTVYPKNATVLRIGSLALLGVALYHVTKMVAGGIGGAIGTVFGGRDVPALEQDVKPGFLVTGRILNPPNGGQIERALFSDSYPMSIELENKGSTTASGPVLVTIEEDRTWPLSNVVRKEVSATYTVAPGQRKVVTLPITVQGLIVGWTNARATASFAGVDFPAVNYEIR